MEENVEVKKDKKGLAVIVVIVFLLVLGLGGYFIFDMLTANNEVNSNNDASIKLKEPITKIIYNENDEDYNEEYGCTTEELESKCTRKLQLENEVIDVTLNFITNSIEVNGNKINIWDHYIANNMNEDDRSYDFNIYSVTAFYDLVIIKSLHPTGSNSDYFIVANQKGEILYSPESKLAPVEGVEYVLTDSIGIDLIGKNIKLYAYNTIIFQNKTNRQELCSYDKCSEEIASVLFEVPYLGEGVFSEPILASKMKLREKYTKEEWEDCRITLLCL